jgi:hypothetical protein
VYPELTNPLSASDVGEWLTFVTVNLLVSAEAVSRFGPARGLLVDKSRLQATAIITGLIVLGIVALRILGMLS